MRIGVKKAGQTVADSVVETTRYIVTVDSGKNKAKNVKLVGERRFMTADVGAAEILFKISRFVNVVIRAQGVGKQGFAGATRTNDVWVEDTLFL